eukprot:jgi/Psemu1/49686/gm1.49686_g
MSANNFDSSADMKHEQYESSLLMTGAAPLFDLEYAAIASLNDEYANSGGDRLCVLCFYFIEQTVCPAFVIRMPNNLPQRIGDCDTGGIEIMSNAKVDET